MARFGFVGGTYQLRTVNAEAQRCQNFYPESIETGLGASPAQLAPTWGLAHFCDLTGPCVRGSFYQNGRLFAVTDQFYEIFANGTQVAHGFLPTDSPLIESIGYSGPSPQLPSTSYVHIVMSATSVFSPKPGDTVILEGLTAHPELNGPATVIQSTFATLDLVPPAALTGQPFFSQVTETGTINPLVPAPVTMVANNANQLLICTGGQLWLFPLASGSIVYSNTPVNISQVIISYNGTANLDYYFTPTAAVPGWTTGTTLTINGATTFPFLNTQTANFLGLDSSGNIHVQLPQSLSKAFTASISAINVYVASTTNATSQSAPTTADQVAAGSKVSWLNPTGVIGASSAAQVLIPSTSAQVYADVLRGQTFRFAVPANATIDGIVANFSLQNAADSLFVNGNVGAQLQKAGTGGVGNTPNETIPTTSGFQTISFGAPTDLWGTTWSPADINAAGFGLGVHVAGQYNGQTNLIANGDFEIGLDTNPAPNWTTANSNTQWGYSGQHFTGSRSYGVIPIDTSGSGPNPAIQYDFTISVTPGQILQLSGAILNTSLATQGTILCQFYDNASPPNFISQQLIANTTSTIANFPTQPFTVLFTVPAGASQMLVSLANDNSIAACYYDDVQVLPGHIVQAQNYSITVYYHDTFYNADVNLNVPLSPFQIFNQPLTFNGLTHNPQLNGNTYPMSDWRGLTVTIGNIPATAPYNASETGTVTGDVNDFTGPETGTVSGNVISYTQNPVQVATTLGPFSWAGFLDGFFLALLTPDAQTAQGKTMQYSKLEDGTTWFDVPPPAGSGLDWNFRVLPFTDSVLGAIVNQRNLWLYGPKQSIVYYNSGDLLNPFQPIPGAFLEYGLAAEWSPAKLDNAVFWLGADERGWAMAFRSSGWSEQRVSNHAIEQEWNDYPTVSDAITYSMQTDGHEFYHVYFPAANRSWRYDVSTGMWHEPRFWAVTQNVAHRSRNHVFAFNQHLLGDIQTGSLYLTKPALVTDDVVGAPQNPISRMRRAPHITNELEWEFHHRLRVHLETGLGPMPPFTGQADGDVQLAFLDANGGYWQANITDFGQWETAPYPTAEEVVIALTNISLADIAYLPYQVVIYALGISTSGVITLTPVSMPQASSGYVQHLPLQTWPSGLQTGLYVSYGQLWIDPPQLAPREPQVMLRFSDDGGHSWSNEYICGAGLAGEWKRRVEFRRLGRSRDRIYEVRMIDPITWRLVDAYLDTTPTHKVVERYAKQLAKMA